MGTISVRDQFVCRAPKLAARVIGGEAIIMDPSDSSLFSLNETATAIWSAADGRATLREIVESSLCAFFEVELDVALSDAEELVESLAQRSILLVSPEPIAAAGVTK